MTPVKKIAKYIRKQQGGKVDIDDLNWDTNEAIDQIINDETALEHFEVLDVEGLRNVIPAYASEWDIDPDEVDYDAVYAYLKDDS